MSPENQPEPETLDDLDSETVEDLDVGHAAADIAGGWDFTTTTCFGTK